jgi:uncharacterized damage-inducible protein DinB
VHVDNEEEQLVEAWRTNNRISLFLIDHISDEGMKCTLSKRGGRNVVRQFCHLHNVRIYQLENRARDLAKGLHKFETYEEPDKKTLKKHFVASGERIETFLEEILAGKPKRRGFKKGVIANLGYFIAHDSHHRGSILLTLKECGHNLDQNTRYAIWNWDKI